MFTVPGWSIPADAPRLQGVEADQPLRPSRKRKRKSAGEKHDQVAHAEQTVEPVRGGLPDPETPKSSMESQVSRTRVSGQYHYGQRKSSKGHNNSPNNLLVLEKSSKAAPPCGSPATTRYSPTTDVVTTTQPHSPSNLTPLQLKMRQKLISSRFRHLNEALYTNPSFSSLELFKSHPDLFKEYHQGFKQQASTWPEDPVSGFINWIRMRGRTIRTAGSFSKQTFPSERKGKRCRADGSSARKTANILRHEVAPLPRNRDSGVCAIVDLGCGDAQIARVLSSRSVKSGRSEVQTLNLQIHSFDLAATNEYVTITDISNLPLPDGSIDVAILCLALMGTNWIDFIEEAWRVLRWKGECWICEVSSRFSSKKTWTSAHSFGKRAVGGRRALGSSTMGPRIKEADDENSLSSEEPGVDNHTDVSAFVAVMKRRGFELCGALDLSNKMFARMRFVKQTTPSTGKFTPQVLHKPSFTRERSCSTNSNRTTCEEESKVLKPCLYKIR